MISVLLGEIGGYLVAALAAIVGIAVAYFRGRSEGKSQERTERAAQVAEQAQAAQDIAREVQDETAGMDDDAIDRDLARWVRNKSDAGGR